jgi:hypothetical protein
MTYITCSYIYYMVANSFFSASLNYLNTKDPSYSGPSYLSRKKSRSDISNNMFRPILQHINKNRFFRISRHSRTNYLLKVSLEMHLGSRQKTRICVDWRSDSWCFSCPSLTKASCVILIKRTSRPIYPRLFLFYWVCTISFVYGNLRTCVSLVQDWLCSLAGDK